MTRMNTVILGFGPQPMDFFKHALKVCGKDAVASPDVARMAGANLAAGNPEALEMLRARLEMGALDAQRTETPGLSSAATRWLASGERGTSSNTMFSTLTGVDALSGAHPSHPYDPDDLDRCLQLLEAMPELRAKLPVMAHVSPEWAALVRAWDAVEACHLSEVGLRWTKATRAPKTYDLMRAVFSEARSA
jgi:hypothetical protein